MDFFDAHLDLAYLSAAGRDMRSTDLGSCGGPDLPAAVTLPTLAAPGPAGARITHALATIFTECDGADSAISYPAGDAAAAHRVGVQQLEIYRQWREEGRIRLRSDPQTPVSAALRAGILIECADPIRTPDELAWWVERGVVAVGMAWVRAGRYAGGNSTDLGLTDLGRALVTEIDRLGVIHDASHLSDRALEHLFEATDRTVIASHSNCRTLIDRPAASAKASSGQAVGGASAAGTVPPFQRHLTDRAIREIIRRGGVVGLNLFSPFLVPGGGRDRRATLAEAIAHVDHICTIAGNRMHVGLGSDMDGGFSARMLPEGIDHPRDVIRLAEALRDIGWNDADIALFSRNNWLRIFDQGR